MGKHGGGHVDVEKGGTPELRWAFIRKVYAIVALQLLATISVAATVYLVPDIRAFFLARTPASLAAFVLILVAPILVMIPMMCLRNRHPINLILLALFTICMSFSVGLGCLSRKGVIIIEAATLTFVVVLSLTLYTFWAAKRGHDFSFLGPFLFAACLILMLFSLIQMLMPMGKVGTTVYGCVSALVFSGFIIYDTDNLIKRHAYDEYVTAAISLYLDIINIFMAILSALSDC